VGAAPFAVCCDIALSGWSLDALKKRAATFLGADAAQSDEPWGRWEQLLYAPADAFDALNDALKTVTKAALAQSSRDASSGAKGGERPKIALYVEDSNGAVSRPVLLTFARPSERPDSVVAEASALTLAAELGLRVPAHEVQWFNDAPALSISRFERGEGLSRPVYHCVSGATALDLLPGSDVEDARRNDVRLRSKLKRPADALELCGRIVLNAVVGNTDDHPWNTSLRQVGVGDWELAPLYDVLPILERQGVPTFRMSFTLQRPSRAATRANLVAADRQIARLDEADAWAVVERTRAHVHENWRRVFTHHGAQHPDARPDAWARVFEPDGLGQ
jgi:serine/threonine-protein kinase HipA